MVKFCFIFFVSIIVTMSFTGCINMQTDAHDQNSLPDVASKPAGSRGPLQGSIKTDPKLELAVGINNEERINQTSFGKLFLVFWDSNKNEFKSEIPAEGVLELNLYLRERLKYCTQRATISDANSGLRQDMDLGQKVNETKNRLLEIQIDTPEERRKISYEEAGKLIEYVGISAIDLCQSLNEKR